MGNLIDRVATGRVVDFIDVYVMDWHWPAFNVADSAITDGNHYITCRADRDATLILDVDGAAADSTPPDISPSVAVDLDNAVVEVGAAAAQQGAHRVEVLLALAALLAAWPASRRASRKV